MLYKNAWLLIIKIIKIKLPWKKILLLLLFQEKLGVSHRAKRSDSKMQKTRHRWKLLFLLFQKLMFKKFIVHRVFKARILIFLNRTQNCPHSTEVKIFLNILSFSMHWMSWCEWTNLGPLMRKSISLLCVVLCLPQILSQKICDTNETKLLKRTRNGFPKTGMTWDED